MRKQETWKTQGFCAVAKPLEKAITLDLHDTVRIEKKWKKKEIGTQKASAKK